MKLQVLLFSLISVLLSASQQKTPVFGLPSRMKPSQCETPKESDQQSTLEDLQQKRIAELALFLANRPTTPVEPEKPIKPTLDLSELDKLPDAMQDNCCSHNLREKYRAYESLRDDIRRHHERDLSAWKQRNEKYHQQMNLYKIQQSFHPLAKHQFEKRLHEYLETGSTTPSEIDMRLEELQSALTNLYKPVVKANLQKPVTDSDSE